MKKLIAMIVLFLLVLYRGAGSILITETGKKPSSFYTDIIAAENLRLFNIEYDRRVALVKYVARRYNPDVSSDIINAIVEASYKYDGVLSVELLCAVITHESGNWSSDVKSHTGDIGLMQLQPNTAIELAADEGIIANESEIKKMLVNGPLNIRLGSRYLASMVSRYGIEKGLVGYNGGPSRARKKTDSRLQTYVPLVLRHYKEYQVM